jgi:hypothetical protein
LSPRLALLFHTVLVNSGPFDDRLKTGVSLAMTGAAQYWLANSFDVILVVGFGVADYTLKSPQTIQDLFPAQGGFAGVVGVGVSPIALRHHAIGIRAEFAPVFTDSWAIAIYSIAASWQFY